MISNLLKSWSTTGYFSSSTGSSVTNCRLSPIIALGTGCRMVDYANPGVKILIGKHQVATLASLHRPTQYVTDSRSWGMQVFFGYVLFLIGHLVYLIGVWVAEDQRTDTRKTQCVWKRYVFQISSTTPHSIVNTFGRRLCVWVARIKEQTPERHNVSERDMLFNFLQILHTL